MVIRKIPQVIGGSGGAGGSSGQYYQAPLSVAPAAQQEPVAAPPTTTNRNISSARLVLTSLPVPADRGQRNGAAINAVSVHQTSHPVPDPDDDVCKRAADDLMEALNKAIQIFNQVPQEKHNSQILRRSLMTALITLDNTLGASNQNVPSADMDSLVKETAWKTAEQTVLEISQRLPGLLQSKIQQHL